MRESQKRMREVLEKRWKPEPGALKKAFDEVVAVIPSVFEATRWQYTDYPRTDQFQTSEDGEK